MPLLLGTAPNQVPTNADLGTMAFEDANSVNIQGGLVQNATISPANVTAYQLVANSYPSTPPSLMLDFANSKTLDPRITFTRASTATYYDGYTSAVAEQNLLLYSQDFTQTYWGKSTSIITANTTVSPDGTTTATSLVENTANSTHAVSSAGINNQTVPLGATLTVSIYLKANTRTYCALALSDTVAKNYAVLVDLSAGTISNATGFPSYSAPTASAIQSVGNGWYRVSVTTTLDANRSSCNSSVNLSSTSGGTYTYLGDGTSGLYIWGAQLEQRSAVTAYNVTTTAAITNYIPVLQTAASGVARLDYNPTTGESLGLLIEESRTNLLVNSATFVASSNIAVTTSANVSPDGTLNASYAIPNATSGYHNTSTSSTVVTATAYTMSVFAKAGAYTRLGVREGVGSGTAALFDLTAGTVISGTGTITPVGNSWYRCVVPFTSSGTSASLTCFPYPSSTTNPLTIFSGDGFSGVYLWGQQLEAGAFATSYIPTVASQVTRAADAASMTGTNFSSWFNQSAGSLYAEYQYNWINTANTTGKVVSFTPVVVGSYAAINTIGGAGTGWFASGLSVGAAVSGSLTKQVITYISPNTFSAELNSGAAVSSTVSDFKGTSTALSIGLRNSDQWMNGWIKRITYYPVALTSTQLVALTT